MRRDFDRLLQYTVRIGRYFIFYDTLSFSSLASCKAAHSIFFKSLVDGLLVSQFKQRLGEYVFGDFLFGLLWGVLKNVLITVDLLRVE